MIRGIRRIALTVLAAVAILPLAACNDGSPREQPRLTVDEYGRLSEKRTVTVAISSRIFAMLPVLVSDVWDDFESRNINLKVEQVSSTDGLLLLSQGKVDVQWTGLSANLLNAIASGMDVKFVAPGFTDPPGRLTGWYVAADQVQGGQISPRDFVGKTVSAAQGVGGAPVIGLAKYLETGGVGINELKIVNMPQSDAIVALQQGSIFAANTSEPNSTAVRESGVGLHVAKSQPDGYPSVGALFGPTLLKEQPEVGKAFVAALRSVYVRHFQGNYVANPETAQMIADVTESTLESVRANGSDDYPTELTLPADYIKTYEDVWRQIDGVLNYQGSIAERAVDTSFMEFANSTKVEMP